MESLKALLLQARVIPCLTQLLRPEQECYLVGGALRDFLLGRAVEDFDFAVPGDPTPLARAFAQTVGGTWFPLDTERQQSRVVRKGKGGCLVYDFAPFRGADLAADLKGRDFTLNAMALPLLPAGSGQDILDPLQGHGALVDRRLVACSPDAFRDDPLRVLRGIRHAVMLGMEFESETLRFMISAAPLVTGCATERIREELIAVFGAPRALRGLFLLYRLGLMPALFGPGDFDRGSQLAGETDAVFPLLQPATAGVVYGGALEQVVEDGMSRAGRLRLAAFLRGYGTNTPEELPASGLRLSRRNLSVIGNLLRLGANRGDELPGIRGTTVRGRALWADSLGSGPIDALLFLAVINPRVRAHLPLLRHALEDFVTQSKKGRVPDLVDGRRLCRHLSIRPGPELGKLLAEVRSEEIAGRIRDPREVMEFVASRAQKKD